TPRLPASVQADPDAALAVDGRPVGVAVVRIDADERLPLAKRAVLADLRALDRALQRIDEVQQPPVRRHGGAVGDLDIVDRRLREDALSKAVEGAGLGLLSIVHGAEP